MSKSIEVELRGPLDDSAYQAILTTLKEKGRLIKKQNRLLLDYSTFLEGIGERKLDVRTRVTNGKVEVVVKKGVFGGTAREEASIFPEGGSLADTLRLMSFLGYTKAVACDRAMERYEIEGIEFVIQDVRNFNAPGTVHSRFYEAEIMAADEAEKEAAVQKIKGFLSTHSLPVFAEEDWNAYVARMNTEANGVFDFSKDSVDVIKDLGQI
jgi:adenylate cyclase class IV